MNNEEELDLIQAIKISWKKRKIIFGIIIACVLIGLVYTFIINRPIYQSTSKILIDKADASISEFVKSSDIMAEVASNFNVQRSYISEKATVSFDKNTKILTISVSSTDNKEALNIVNKYQEILKTRLESVYDIKVYSTIEQAQISENPYNVNHVKDMIVSIGVGFILAGVYCIFIVVFSEDNIFKTVENNGLILLGKISKENKANSKVKAYISRNDKIIAQVKQIMTNIELNKQVHRPKSILVTSPDYETGTTYVVSNLAIRYSKSGKNILIIDSNFKKGIENKIFNIDSENGITNLLSEEDISLENINKKIKQSPISNIYVLPCGDVHIDEEMLISEKISKIIELLKNQFDIIIIDGEPILKQISSVGWASIVDAVVIVAEYSKTKAEDLIKAKTTIENIDGKISGVVINKVED